MRTAHLKNTAVPTAWHVSDTCTQAYQLTMDYVRHTLWGISCLWLVTHGRQTEEIQWICYNERVYNERMLQRTVFIDKIRMLQRTQMLQRKWRNTIGRRSTRVRMTCRALPLWSERQSSSLLSFVRFSYQFSSVIFLFVQCIQAK